MSENQIVDDFRLENWINCDDIHLYIGAHASFENDRFSFQPNKM